jgi:hypothetical protein
MFPIQVIGICPRLHSRVVGEEHVVHPLQAPAVAADACLLYAFCPSLATTYPGCCSREQPANFYFLLPVVDFGCRCEAYDVSTRLLGAAASLALLGVYIAGIQLHAAQGHDIILPVTRMIPDGLQSR